MTEQEFFHAYSIGAMDFEHLYLYNVCMRGMDLRKCNMRHVRFERCDMRGADLRGVDLTTSRFYQCHIGGANMEGCIVTGVILQETRAFDLLLALGVERTNDQGNILC